MRIGIDIGSTTLKAVVLDEEKHVLFEKYVRHYSRITEKTSEMLGCIREMLGPEKEVSVCISGSAGMGLAESLGLPFVQEVYATRLAVHQLNPGTDVVIELGGEDAKILFLSRHAGAKVTDDLEVRMNGSCAGGTGAFVDQMATLLAVSPDEMNQLARRSEKAYTIASRCGVFAKSDIQPLLNQGAKKEDVAASIFQAVVNQTIAGLAQGRNIEGRILYLGGPLTFLSELRACFDRTLKACGLCPEHSLYYVAYGAALSGGKSMSLEALIASVQGHHAANEYVSCPPLFQNEQEYEAFCERHARAKVPMLEAPEWDGPVWIGIDAGSTTVKCAVIDEAGRILFSRYLPNGGNPVPLVRRFLTEFYAGHPRAVVAGAASTGYGEDIIKNAFRMDLGVVETIAHFTAARHFQPDVDFIIDIGGQDIKCFKIRQGAIDNIFLNEACSSGCGSFLQTFAGAWGDSIDEFARRGLLADRPVDLGSRCTVFMNSSVKQAQKDGASLENISAGLSISVVKNALYKVIRTANASLLGEHIVVQGGTFLNDAVLRAFEKEIGRDVVRPGISGLMGAYGAALYARKQGLERSTLLTPAELNRFEHTTQAVSCGGCANHCALTVNRFGEGRSFISGNRCEKPLARAGYVEQPTMYDFKQKLLGEYRPVPGSRGRIGIPMGLNMYELLPFWHTFLTRLGFEVIVSQASDRKLYLAGQHTIPSDTVCYPAKLMHGHIEGLLDQGVDAIFYPCMSYNFDEGRGDNHYNCPVVAYYPEVLRANIPELKKIRFICDYVGPHRRKDFPGHIYETLKKYFGGISRRQVHAACQAAYAEYDAYMEKIRAEGDRLLALAEEKRLPVIVLAGRPYHLDPEINHGIHRLIAGLGAVVVSEDAICGRVEKFPTHVLNQWTYHARLYSAARFVAQSQNPDINLVQMVSFGCGVDAITTDEVRSILEGAGRVYTQIKIDEITNLGAVRIRMRSLFAAIEGEKGRER